MALHCARIWAARGESDFVLIGRDAQRLAHAGMDLQTRFPEVKFETRVVDFTNGQAISDTAKQIAQTGPIHRVLIAHGQLPDQQACEKDINLLQSSLIINGVSPVLFAQAFAHHMAKQPHDSTLCVIGSVAGDRGRKSNLFYGAGKSMVATCIQGLQHRYADTQLSCVLIKPGPTRTPMTAMLNIPDGRLASVESVAIDIVKAMDTRVHVLYTPWKWRWIMWVIRQLPASIFNKLNI